MNEKPQDLKIEIDAVILVTSSLQTPPPTNPKNPELAFTPDPVNCKLRSYEGL